MLFQQHREQEHLERQGVTGIRGRSQVLAGRGEQAIQRDLVTPAQGAPEAGEGLLLLQEVLGDGWKGAAHGMNAQKRAGWLAGAGRASSS